jgi:hypothetical protein
LSTNSRRVRRSVSPASHSRACWSAEYSTAGRVPSGVVLAFFVTFIA